MLAVEGLVKAYRHKAVLHGVRCHVAPGELLGLVGPNGAGKTTLLRCVSGLLGFDAGTITVDAAAAGSLTARRTVGYLAEEPALFPYLSVAEHLQFIARAYRVPDWRERSERLLERLGLVAERTALGGTLSQGMRRKTALAMVLLHDCRLLLLDEPFNGLDPQAQQELRVLLAELRREGIAVVMSTHRLVELAQLTDSYAVLSFGRLVTGGLGELRAASGLGSDAGMESVYLALTSG